MTNITPTKKAKLQNLLTKLNDLEKRSALPIAEVDDLTNNLIEQEIAKLTLKLKGDPVIQTLEKFKNQLAKFKQLDLTAVIEAVKSLQTEIAKSEQTLLQEFEDRIKAIPQPDLTGLAKLRTEFEQKLATLPQPEDLKPDLDLIRQQLQDMTSADIEQDKQDKLELDKSLTQLRLEVMNRINNIGGGSMNRQIFIGGTDRLTRYTDINIKAGANVTLTSANNDTTKKVDITIAASGGGSGGGITREIDSISASTNAGSTSATDYVYLCTGTLILTLPDAAIVGSNLYTIKNVGSGTVTINTTSAQTIDGSTSITLPVRYTSVDLESDTANWNVT